MIRLLLSMGFALLMITGCSDKVTSTEMVFDEQPPGDGTSAGEEVTFTFIQENVFDVSCAVSGCHAGVEFPNLSAGRAYGNIVDAASSSGLKLVAPGDPENSYLYIKITGGEGMNGSRMPWGGPPLPAARIEAVRKWIERGAPND